MKHRFFDCGRYRLKLGGEDARPLVMGILNVTPDSFSDGGRFSSLESAVIQAERMIDEGVDIIDIGGESSRPGAVPLPLQEELRRVMPVIYALRDCGKPLSIDTYKPEVMREALAADADMINDIQGFRTADAIDLVKTSTCGVCIMHMLREPTTMQVAPRYEDVVADVSDFLADRARFLQSAGVATARILVDPGFGFGKTQAHNLELLRNIAAIRDRAGAPILAGLSRKAMVGAITGRPVEQRLAGSLAAALAAVSAGADIVRVHDVAETIDALKVWQTIRSSSE